MATGTTYDFTLSRNDLIRSAFRKVGVIEPDPQQITYAANTLNAIVRELDPRADIFWAVTKNPSTLTLIANTFLYTTSGDLQSNILRLESVIYRDSSGYDKELAILTPKGYEGILNKFEIGNPDKVYLTEDIDLAARQLYLVPSLSSVNSQSEVIGTDALNYRCIRSHTANSNNEPITGDNYLLYWEQAGAAGVAWVDGESYTAPQLLRYIYRRPLWDFDLSTDNPDFPQAWIRILILRLADDLADEIPGIPVEIKQRLSTKVVQAMENINNTLTRNTNDIHNKAEYF